MVDLHVTAAERLGTEAAERLGAAVERAVTSAANAHVAAAERIGAAYEKAVRTFFIRTLLLSLIWVPAIFGIVIVNNKNG
jgi:hypothetical protein